MAGWGPLGGVASLAEDLSKLSQSSEAVQSRQHDSSGRGTEDSGKMFSLTDSKGKE